MELRDLLDKEITHKKLGKGTANGFELDGVDCLFGVSTRRFAYSSFGVLTNFSSHAENSYIKRLAVLRDKNYSGFEKIINDFKRSVGKSNTTVPTPGVIPDKIRNEIYGKRVLFCNISYMKEYKGITDNDVPINGGKFVDENANAWEKYNFMPLFEGMTKGFVEPGFTKGGYDNGGRQRQIHIEKIDPNYKNENTIPDVTVIMCSKSPIVGKTVVVGWYDNATVYRKVEVGNYYGRDYWCTFMTKNEDAHLIPENLRDFVIPRAASEGVGFGQSNIWYAKKPEEQDIVSRVLTYLKNVKELIKRGEANGKGNALFINDVPANTKHIIELRTKKEALNYLKEKGISLKNSNKLNYAKFQNDKKIFWLNPQIDRLTIEWQIVLNDQINHKLIFIEVPANTFTIKKKDNTNGFYIRADKPQLDINIKNNTFIEMRSKIDFTPYIVSEFDY